MDKKNKFMTKEEIQEYLKITDLIPPPEVKRKATIKEHILTIQILFGILLITFCIPGFMITKYSFKTGSNLGFLISFLLSCIVYTGIISLIMLIL